MLGIWWFFVKILSSLLLLALSTTLWSKIDAKAPVAFLEDGERLWSGRSLTNGPRRVFHGAIGRQQLPELHQHAGANTAFTREGHQHKFLEDTKTLERWAFHVNVKAAAILWKNTLLFTFYLVQQLKFRTPYCALNEQEIQMKLWYWYVRQTTITAGAYSKKIPRQDCRVSQMGLLLFYC